MKAIRDLYDGTLTIRVKDLVTGEEIRLPGAPKFVEFCAGIGWADPKGNREAGEHGVVVIGMDESDRFHVFAEYSGSLPDVAIWLVAWKDRLLIDRIFYDPSNEEGRRFLLSEACDGLTEYRTEKDDDGEWQRIHLDTYWPTFRDSETVANLVMVSETMRENVDIAMDRIQGLISSNRLVVLGECPVSGRLIRHGPPYQEVYEHPIYRAMAWCVGMMLRNTAGRITLEEVESKRQWYENIR